MSDSQCREEQLEVLRRVSIELRGWIAKMNVKPKVRCYRSRLAPYGVEYTIEGKLCIVVFWQWREAVDFALKNCRIQQVKL